MAMAGELGLLHRHSPGSADLAGVGEGHRWEAARGGERSSSDYGAAWAAAVASAGSGRGLLRPASGSLPRPLLCSLRRGEHGAGARSSAPSMCAMDGSSSAPTRRPSGGGTLSLPGAAPSLPSSVAPLLRASARGRRARPRRLRRPRRARRPWIWSPQPSSPSSVDLSSRGELDVRRPRTGEHGRGGAAGPRFDSGAHGGQAQRHEEREGGRWAAGGPRAMEAHTGSSLSRWELRTRSRSGPDAGRRCRESDSLFLHPGWRVREGYAISKIPRIRLCYPIFPRAFDSRLPAISISRPQLRARARITISRPAGGQQASPIDPAMPQLFRPPRVTPTPLEPSPPLDPVSMPSPPPPAPAPPLALALAAEDEERPLSLPMKMKLLLPKAVTCVFGGMNRFWGMALGGLHAVICVVKVLSFTTDPELARFCTRFFRSSLYIGLAIMVLMTCEWIYTYYYVYLPQQEAAAASQLPPPPPEMDMC